MSSVDHYRNHLSRFYTWMLGDFDSVVTSQMSLLKRLEIEPTDRSRIALDLGSGSGAQSIALKSLGFDVYAVDLSEELLNELRDRAPQVHTRMGDIRDLAFAEELKPSVAVCMGDTLTHLESYEEVCELLRAIYKALSPDGQLVLSFRDLSVRKADLERFIPVKSDESRILTCFLEDIGPKVKVYDLLYEREGGQWILKKSFYEKLKISSELVKREAQKVGFSHVTCERLPSGLEVVHCRKP